MDQLRCSSNSLPRYLYRVQYPGSQTQLAPDGSLEARDLQSFYAEHETALFRQSVLNQMTWAWREPQPFITVFSDKKHAENWALKQPWRLLDLELDLELDRWELITIESECLSDVYVFKLSDLMIRLNFSVPEGARQHVNGAYLCLHRMPASAILECQSDSDIEDSACQQSSIVTRPKTLLIESQKNMLSSTTH